MKRWWRFAAILVVSMAATMRAEAGGDSGPAVRLPPIPDVERIVFNCNNDRSARYVSGNAQEMHQAGGPVVRCLREVIIENMVALSGEKERRKIVQELDDIRDGAGGFYWTLYNGIKPCFRDGRANCGRTYYTFHNAEVERIYERILRDVVRKRLEHGW